MRHSWKTYTLLVVVLVASFVAASMLAVHDLAKEIIAFPGVAAMVAIVIQIMRDQSAFERQLELQNQERFFNLGITSKMAELTFNKHVEFCEKYMAELHATLTTLFREGPSQKAQEHAGNFFAIHREFAAWIPLEISEKLKPFEDVIWKIGTLAHLESAMRGTDKHHETRNSALNEMYGAFASVMYMSQIPSEWTKVEGVAGEAVKEHIRTILGVNELTQMRSLIVSKALKNLIKTDG